MGEREVMDNIEAAELYQRGSVDMGQAVLGVCRVYHRRAVEAERRGPAVVCQICGQVGYAPLHIHPSVDIPPKVTPEKCPCRMASSSGNDCCGLDARKNVGCICHGIHAERSVSCICCGRQAPKAKCQCGCEKEKCNG